MTAAFIILDVILVSYISLHRCNFAVLNTHSIIAIRERQLIFIALMIMAIVIVPVLIFSIFVAIHYSAFNFQSKYMPEWDHHNGIQILWRTFTIFMVSTMEIINCNYTHSLDSSRAIVSTNPVLTIEIIALRLKWLFIYLQQDIASVNLLEITENTPVHFEHTADQFPMTSFWVPQLGEQIYTMSGMSTQTHPIANNIGNYYKTSTEINGEGF